VQQLQGPRVWPVIELMQGLLEQRPVGAVRGCLDKQGETGPKLEIVGRVENFERRLALGPSRAAHFDATGFLGLDQRGSAWPSLTPFCQGLPGSINAVPMP
jgi:hypothetical protein